MTGEILRLKKFRTYAAETKPKTGAQWMEGSAEMGMHIVVAVLGKVPASMKLSEQFLDDRMAVLGWVRKVD